MTEFSGRASVIGRLSLCEGCVLRMQRGFRSLVVSVVAAASVFLGVANSSAEPASPKATGPNTSQLIMSAWTANALYISCAAPFGGGGANGTYITLWDCSGAGHWHWSGSYIVNDASGKCLTPQGGHSGTDGTQLTLWTCGTDTSQYFVPFLSGHGIYTQLGDLCITPEGGKFAGGTNLTLWDCNSDPSQDWAIE